MHETTWLRVNIFWHFWYSMYVLKPAKFDFETATVKEALYGPWVGTMKIDYTAS
jgi:hypothetical protein